MFAGVNPMRLARAAQGNQQGQLADPQVVSLDETPVVAPSCDHQTVIVALLIVAVPDEPGNTRALSSHAPHLRTVLRQVRDRIITLIAIDRKIEQVSTSSV
ncbi:MAG: hypothetical protein ACRDTA_03485 [Pseudonocardiaceae bacterium]